jgi:hypothetical protein
LSQSIDDPASVSFAVGVVRHGADSLSAQHREAAAASALTARAARSPSTRIRVVGVVEQHRSVRSAMRSSHPHRLQR